MTKPDLSLLVKSLCMNFKTSRYSHDKYDGSNEWIMRRLLEYANISKDINSEKGQRSNDSHAYNLIHELCDYSDRERIRYLYKFYKTAKKVMKTF